MASKSKGLDFSNLVSEVLEDAIKTVSKDKNISGFDKSYNIIDFAEKVLKIGLREAQKIILKFLYANSKFNEDLKITDEDIEEIKKWDIPQEWLFKGLKNKLELLEEGKKCDHLVLVLGRRAGKSYLSALIAVYEAYKLLELGDPQGYYGIDSDIYIINTAVSEKQANSEIYTQIRKFVIGCPYFHGKVGKDIDGEMHLFTDADIKANEETIKREGPKAKTLLSGSVVIMAGSSNARALRGHAAICIIYDEAAHYMDDGKKASFEEVYNALSPATTTFKDDDGKNIIISSPLKKSGYFFNQFELGKTEGNYQVFQVASYDANPTFTIEKYNAKLRLDPVNAQAEYGARFIRIGSNVYFPEEIVMEAFRKKTNFFRQKRGMAGRDYYMHIDPATSSDNWAIFIAHPEWRWDAQERQRKMYVVQDYSAFWTPPKGGYLSPNRIMDEEVIPLFKKFPVVSVTFDQMFEMDQREKLKKRRINSKPISFAGRAKNEIYNTMKDLFIQGRIELCSDDIPLQEELLSVIRDDDRDPPKIKKDPNGLRSTDDLVDCLGGVVLSMLSGAVGRTSLPRSAIVHTGRF